MRTYVKRSEVMQMRTEAYRGKGGRKIGVLLRTYFMDDANKRCKKDIEEGEK